MGGAYSTYGTAKVYTGIWWRNLRERDHLENPGLNERITFRFIIFIYYCIYFIIYFKGRGKVFTLPARCGPEGG